MTVLPNWMHLILLGGPETVRLGLAEAMMSPLISASAAAEAFLLSSSASLLANSNISRSFYCGKDRVVSASPSPKTPPYGFAFNSFSTFIEY